MSDAMNSTVNALETAALMAYRVFDGTREADICQLSPYSTPKVCPCVWTMMQLI